MANYTIKGKDPATALRELKKLIRKHMRMRSGRIKQAVKRAARKGARVVRKNVPVAFSTLRDSVEAQGTRIIVGAPHAASVNNGSRPHFPPIDAIEKWVKLRGTQGLLSNKQKSRLPGPSSYGAATRIASAISDRQTGATGRRRGAMTEVDVPRKVAFLIARGIAKRGTRPHRFMEASMPTIVDILDAEIRKAIPDKGGGKE